MLDAEDGTATVPSVDPRLRTGSELYANFFGISKTFPSKLGLMLHRYQTYASNPYRDDREDAIMVGSRAKLIEAGIDVGFEPEPRAGR